MSEDRKTTFVFDVEEERAKEILLHEIVELLITDLIMASNEKSFHTLKEAVVEVLRRLISEKEITE